MSRIQSEIIQHEKKQTAKKKNQLTSEKIIKVKWRHSQVKEICKIHVQQTCSKRNTKGNSSNKDNDTGRNQDEGWATEMLIVQ